MSQRPMNESQDAVNKWEPDFDDAIEEMGDAWR